MDVVDLIYIFDNDASSLNLKIKGELFKYLIKVRRHSVGDEIGFRNRDSIEILHTYKIIDIDARVATFELIDSKECKVEPKHFMHLAWCVIDTKSIEKVLPSLNEIGVGKISFIYCDRSQRNIKLDFKRFERILEASMQQCGRTSYMEFDVYKNIESFIKEFDDVKVFDFCQNILDAEVELNRVLIGCEGGFSAHEKEMLKNQKVFRLDTPMVLRSESATVAVASKILL